MKDKRQRIAVAWPYAAVYADPTFAASLLQAAANSVGMPYYAPNPMIPQMPVIAPSQIPTAVGNHYTYGYRYSPYQIPHRNPTNIPHHSHSSHLSSPPNQQMFTRSELGNGLNSSLTSDHLRSPTSPLSPLSLSPVSESEKVNTLTPSFNFHFSITDFPEGLKIWFLSFLCSFYRCPKWHRISQKPNK